MTNGVKLLTNSSTTQLRESGTESNGDDSENEVESAKSDESLNSVYLSPMSPPPTSKLMMEISRIKKEKKDAIE